MNIYKVKNIEGKFGVIHDNGPLSGSNAIPSAKLFDTFDEAMYALYVLDRFGPYEFWQMMNPLNKIPA